MISNTQLIDYVIELFEFDRFSILMFLDFLLYNQF